MNIAKTACALTLLSCIALPSQSAMAVETFEIKNTLKHMCLDIAGYSGGKGRNAQLWDCQNLDDQRFYFADVYGNPVRIQDAKNNYYFLRNAKSDLCLDVAGHGGWENDTVQLWTCEGAYAFDQQWKIEFAPYEGPYEGSEVILLRNGARNKILDVGGTSGSKKNNVQLWTYRGYSDQYWYFANIRN